MRMQLKNVLPQGVRREDFLASIKRVKKNYFPTITVEELLCHPLSVLEFCFLVRYDLHHAVTDHVICKTLLNLRKTRKL